MDSNELQPGHLDNSECKVRWGFVAAVPAALLLQSYFVRVLLASEFLFALVFAASLLIGGAAI